MPPVTEYLAVLTTGFLGGAHCIGMCGGFVLMYSVEASGGTSNWYAHLTYNMGRILTYSLVGGFMGWVGSFVEAAGRIKGVQGLALIVAGFFMVLMGLNLMGVLGRRDALDSSGLTGLGAFRSAFRSLVGSGGPLSMLPLGLLLGLVPCGLSYTMEIKAASSGGFWQGFTLMTVFGLGTVPAMAGFGFFSSYLTGRLKDRIYRLAAAMVILLGVQAFLRGLASSGIVPHWIFW